MQSKAQLSCFLKLQHYQVYLEAVSADHSALGEKKIQQHSTKPFPSKTTCQNSTKKKFAFQMERENLLLQNIMGLAVINHGTIRMEVDSCNSCTAFCKPVFLLRK